jgi:hypothetical protein
MQPHVLGRDLWDVAAAAAAAAVVVMIVVAVVVVVAVSAAAMVAVLVELCSLTHYAALALGAELS